MATTITLTGISGQRYGFTLCDVNLAWNPVPAIYAFVDATGSPKYIGETENLATRRPGPSHEKWAEAQRYGAVAVVAQPASGATLIRKAEEADLIRAYNPPANVQNRLAQNLQGLGANALWPSAGHRTRLGGK